MTATTSLRLVRLPGSAPTAADFLSIVQRLDALLEEANELLGSDSTTGQAQLLISDCPPAVWHTLPGDIQWSESYIWKTVATRHGARLTAFCADDNACPEFKAREAQA